MPFDHCWRWFGPDDPVTLSEARLAGATGIVTALHDFPVGAVWPVDAIMARKRLIEAEGLHWAVAESLPVHDEIKRRGAHHRPLVESYRASLRNLGACGIRTVCYNFMPVLDWIRTDLATRLSNGSITTAFHSDAMAAFDLFILQRPHAEESYDADLIRRAEEYFHSLREEEKERFLQTILLGFPGSGEAYSLEQLKARIAEYADITEDNYRENLASFLEDIVPVAEEAGVHLALHPDDPPWPLLGLPRIVSTGRDVAQVLGVIDTPFNGITLCTGSLGASRQNFVVGLAARFASRINFVHLRNVVSTGPGEFLESDHLEGDVDMYAVVRTLLLEQQRRLAEGREDAVIPMRPDHGLLIEGDRRHYYPGYSLFGRMRGLAELRGLEFGIQRSLGL